MSTPETVIAELEAATADQPKMPLRHHQIAAYEDELRRLGHMMENRDVEGHRWAEPSGMDPTMANRRVREIRKILAEQAPKPLQGDRGNRAYALAQRVQHEVIEPGLMPQAVARRNPAGAVGHYQRTEGSKLFKRGALAFKRAVRALDPENPDPDIANLERFRTAGTEPNGVSTFSVNATIPGSFAFGPAAKANWPLGAPTVETALGQVQRREQATNGHGRRKPKKAPREKRPASPAQLAGLLKAQAALRAKRAAARGEAPRPVETP